MNKEYMMFINGEWVKSASGAVFDDHNPFTGDVFAKVPAANKDDARKAIDAATAAFPAWSATAPSLKQSYLMKAAEILTERQEEIAQMLREETGANPKWAMFQTSVTLGMIREAASQVYRMTGEILPADLPGSFFMVLRQPAGVIGCISPWNAPLILSTRDIAFALAYGNTTVLKPSAESPVTGGVVIAELFEKAGLPKGVLNVVTNGPEGSGAIGDELIDDPRVRRISFTGSSDVGRKIAEKAGKRLKRVLLELGGQDATIILADADIDYAVKAAVFGRFAHQGQICMSSKRIIVEEPIADEFIPKFADRASKLVVGDPRKPDTIIGPLINQEQFDKIRIAVDEAIKGGAKLQCGGKHEGLCYYPTILTDVKPNMKVLAEEMFGPVAAVIVVKDAEEAIRVTNSSPYGLSAGIITRDFTKGLEIAERLETGMAHINDQSVHDEPQVPFGGVKDSGYGRHGGLAAMEEFTERRWVTIQRSPRQYPF